MYGARISQPQHPFHRLLGIGPKDGRRLQLHVLPSVDAAVAQQLCGWYGRVDR